MKAQLVIKKNIKKKINELGLSASQNLDKELNTVVVNILEKATDRAIANNRKTIMPRDL